ncbi:hypothetical protein O5D80_000006 [Batrachochytrium dendrobatidis]|nr:hypothetical protein O5D80_000006 [Batrachochytrium dendrobatidis]
MKLVDILFVLSVAAATNAILIPTNNDGSLQASGTSSQVSGPTDEPSPGTSNEYQQEPMDVVDPSTSNQNQQQSIDELGPSISEQDWQDIIDGPDPGIPEGWRDLVDAVNSNILKDQQQSMNQGKSAKRGRKRPIDQSSSSTSSQHQQQLVGQGESSNTASNRVIILSQKYQKTFDGIKKKLVASKIIQKKKRKEYYKSMALGYRQWSVLSMGKEIHVSKNNPEDEARLKKEYKEACRKASIFRQELKAFMKRRGLKFEEPSSDSDSD